MNIDESRKHKDSFITMLFVCVPNMSQSLALSFILSVQTKMQDGSLSDLLSILGGYLASQIKQLLKL